MKNRYAAAWRLLNQLPYAIARRLRGLLLRSLPNDAERLESERMEHAVQLVHQSVIECIHIEGNDT